MFCEPHQHMPNHVSVYETKCYMRQFAFGTSKPFFDMVEKSFLHNPHLTIVLTSSYHYVLEQITICHIMLASTPNVFKY
jgi:hypothetical protein